MLFNSYEYIFAFLPIMLAVYFLLNRLGYFSVSKTWLVAGSLFFYSWWNIIYLPLLLASILVNYTLGTILGKKEPALAGYRRLIVTAGICFNVGLLGFYKYADFFITNLNTLLPAHLATLGIILPLGISFFTFTQIAYLVDAYRREAREYSLINYALFVSFFPHLLAGPIIHHREMMGQFNDPELKQARAENLARGLFLFAMGLAKKVLIADAFGVWANYGFDTAVSLTLLDGWITSLAYSLQLYFDFSGYTDMAIGASLMFNIRLPNNFNSPYKALSIQEFWRRWHMTLSRFLSQYIYIPLGGNRGGKWKLYRNLMITFLIGGLWHGAGWTFVFWGFLHGLALVIHRIWQGWGYKMNRVLAWFLTFNFVNISWVFFRAHSFADALRILRAMFGMNGVLLPAGLAPYLTVRGVGSQFFGMPVMGQFLPQAVPALLIFILVVLTVKNTTQLTESFKPGLAGSLFTAVIMIASILGMTHISEFLYFNF